MDFPIWINVLKMGFFFIILNKDLPFGQFAMSPALLVNHL